MLSSLKVLTLTFIALGLAVFLIVSFHTLPQPRPQSPIPSESVRFPLDGTQPRRKTASVRFQDTDIVVGGEMRVVEIGDSLDAETKVLGIDRHSVLLETAEKEHVLTLPTGNVLLRGR